MKFIVENIRCGGCTASITDKLTKLHQATDIVIDIESGSISLNTSSAREVVADTLLGLGYPETDSVEGFDKTKAKVKSVVSCAVGKFK